MNPDKSSARCRGCPLGGQPVVPGEGPADANLWIVGLCPGRKEVIEGRPFVGPAGQTLDKALSAAGVARSAIYVTNAVLCHPPAPRTDPPSNALRACRNRLLAEIRQKRPRKLLALGAKATLQVTRDPTSIGDLRKLPSVPFDGPTVVRVTWHPSRRGLNRDPARPKQFDEDIAWLGERDLPQKIRASDIKVDRTAFMTNRQVTEWFKEINGGREPRRAVVPLASVRPNPFAVKMVESAVRSYMAEVLDPTTENPTLFVAGLPGGGYVDVDSAYAHEALVRAGVPLVTVAVVGDFTEADCRRIGLRIDGRLEPPP